MRRPPERLWGSRTIGGALTALDGWARLEVCGVLALSLRVRSAWPYRCNGAMCGTRIGDGLGPTANQHDETTAVRLLRCAGESLFMRCRRQTCPAIIPVVALLAGLFPTAAFAQPTCGPGQTVVDAAGHCCSPGQAWDVAGARCFDPPPPPQGAPGPVVTNLIVSHAPLGDPTAPVPVTFAPAQAGDSETLVLQPVGGPAVTCAVPCVVNLAPGYVTITGNGQRSFQTGLNVPPLAPLTVQVNHLDSAAPRYALGGALVAVGVAATIGSILSFTSSGKSCGDDPETAAETSAQSSCSSRNTSNGIHGALLAPLALGTLIAGTIVLVNAATHGAHPLHLMDPGELSRRPVTGAIPVVRFAGVEPTWVPGGGVLRAGIEF
jgi:hypothetical protein